MNRKVTILVVEDDEGLQVQYKWLLSDYDVVIRADRAQAKQALGRQPAAVAIVDLGLPPDAMGASEGLAAIADIHSVDPETKVIVVTGNESRENAVQAVASGAYDFLTKPLMPDALKLAVERAVRLHDLEQENKRLATAVPPPLGNIVTANSRMLELLRQVERVAKTDVAILITGESGTGKELIARAVHDCSGRARRPFVAINCAAIPESLLEAELFGHEKGAFTGAVRQSIGRIESANEGTLFLDEIGDIPLSMQVKLLRFLQSHEIERVGGRKPIKIDVRIVCATNQNLARLISESRFREDLYYRIDEVSLRLPALRDREGDIVLLANYFLRKYASHFNVRSKGFSAEALAALQAHEWTGNVRELENKVKRAVVMANGRQLRPEDLDLEIRNEAAILSLRDARRRAERNALEIALTMAAGNMAKAAKLLEISRPTLYDLMDQHGLSIAEQKHKLT